MSRRVSKLALATMVTVLSTGMVACKKQESSAELVAQAKQFQQKGDGNAAVIQLKNALLANPDDGEARYLLAVSYNENGDALAAEKEIRRAIGLKYPADKTMPVLGRALIAQGKFKEALQETAVEDGKYTVDTMVMRADAHMALSQRDEAKQLLEQALQQRPGDVTVLTGQARLAMLSGDSDAAIKLVDEAIAKEPGNVSALMLKADMLRALRQIDAALAAYDVVLKANPKHRSAHIEKAYVELASGKFEAAQADLTAARKISPNSLLVLYTQALLDFSQGKSAAAQEGLLKVLRAAPEHMPSVLLAGAVELNLGSYQQAENYLKKFLEKHPTNIYARKMLATTLLRSGQAGGALTALGPALKDQRPDVQVLALAGESYMQARDFDKASEYFGKASELEPKLASLHTSLGLSKLGKGDPSQAISEMELATQLDAKSPQAALALARAELSLKHFDKALAAAVALEKVQPDNAVAHDMKGLAYVGKQDFKQARASFERALTAQPAYFPAAANIAQLDMLEKNPAAAKTHMLAFLERNKKSVEAMTALAGLAAVERNNADATQWLEQAQAVNPTAPAPAVRLISQYLGIKQVPKALALARQVQVANPDHPDVLDALGKSQLASGDKAGALETYSKLVAVLPKSAPAQFQLASVQMLMQNPGAAEGNLKKVLELQPDYPAAQLAFAELHVRKKQPQQALAIAQQLQKKYPQAAVGFLLEGDVLLGQGKAVESLPAFEKALALNKSTPMLVKTMSALRAAGRGAEADKRLALWLQQNPKDSTAKLYMAEVQLNAKQYKLAAEQLASLVKEQPDNAAALNNLAYAYQQEKDPRALATAESAYKLVGDVPAILDTLGWILVEQGNTTRGLPLLQKASSLAPQDGDIRYHLATGLYKSGDKGAARKEVELALADGKRITAADEARALLKQLQ